MITIKNSQKLRRCVRRAESLLPPAPLAGELVKPGVSTKAIDRAVHDFIVSHGAKPSFLGLYGFPASACISVNEVVIHGIPGGYILKEGDIVSVDVGAFYNGISWDIGAGKPLPVCHQHRGTAVDRCDKAVLLRGNCLCQEGQPCAGYLPCRTDVRGV